MFPWLLLCLIIVVERGRRDGPPPVYDEALAWCDACCEAPPEKRSPFFDTDAQAAQGGALRRQDAFGAVPLLQITRLCVSLNVSRGCCVLHQNLGQDIHHNRL